MLACLLLCAAGAQSVTDNIVTSAKDQVSWGTTYDPAYVRIPYPNGDLPRSKGVCTDVVIRALRAAGYDLQKLVHQDMKSAWKQYPRYAGLSKPDTNIDHRRVKNLRVFFARKGARLPHSTDSKQQWKPGDIVTWKLPGNLDHIGVLVDETGASGFPMVVHNLGGTSMDDCLKSWTITGHYRFPRR